MPPTGSAARIIAGKAYVLIEAMDMTGRVLKKIGTKLRSVAAWNVPLRRTMRLLDSIARKMSAIARSIREVGGIMTRSGMQGLFLLGMGAIPVRRSIEDAKTYSDAILGLQAVLRATTDDMRPLDKLIRQLGATTSYTSAEIAEAAQELARGDFNFQEVSDSLADVLNLARAGKVDLPSAAKTMVRNIRAFGMEAKEASRVADALFEASRQGTSTVYELASALSFSSGTAKLMGLSMEQSLGILSQMANAMLAGTKGGTSFNQMLLRMATESDKVKKAYGFDVFEEGKQRDPLALMMDLSRAVKSMSEEDAVKSLASIFNVRGMRAAVIVAEINKVNEAIKEIEGATGEAERAATIMDSGIGGTIRRIMSALNNLSIAFGETFAEPLKEIYKNIVGFLDGLAEWVEKNDQIGRTVLKVGTALATASTVLIGFGIALQNVGVLLAAFIARWKPIAIIGTALKSMSDQFQKTFNKFLTIGNYAYEEITKLFQQGSVEEGFRASIETIGTLWSGTIDHMKMEWDLVWDAMKVTVDKIIYDIQRNLRQIWIDLLETMIPFAEDPRKLMPLGAGNLLMPDAFWKDFGFDKMFKADTSMLDTLRAQQTEGFNEFNDKMKALEAQINKTREAQAELVKATEAETKAHIRRAKLYGSRNAWGWGWEPKRGSMPDRPGSPIDDRGPIPPSYPGKIAANVQGGYEMGTLAAAEKAEENRKSQLDAANRTANATERTYDLLDDRLPEMA